MKRLPSRPVAGFTLIELMVVITIASILLVIAVPSYTSQMRKSRRTEARTALLDLAAREERFFSTNSAYTNLPANLGYAGNFPVPVGSSYYQINVTINAPGSTFSATAAPINGQAADATQCGTFTINNTGQQLVSGGTGAVTCWSK
ncbi:MAG: type pilus assembly protein PilE [Gammaproteobacteria bacterium]|jgi:type IV pilus assembly protein PilE|nr:type pilus assembly protein PilE [Gammaproteobacteria bacterium]